MISIIVPVFNEENTIKVLLKHLDQVSGTQIHELLLIDGGSTDDTLKKVNDYDRRRIAQKIGAFPIKVFRSNKGRAVQMNFGARKAEADILYFLHADSLPPKHFDEAIVTYVKDNKRAGCFRMKFDHKHWWLGLMAWFTKINHRACRGGDQSLFVCKKVFQEIGGYDERYIVFEDNHFIGKLYDQKMFSVIPSWIVTSSRRYREHGVWRLQYYFLIIYIKRWFGASGEELCAYYKKKVVK
ncbi:TIGR04283 family arsenosugar biosynthesis glycosyltransferase [Aquimarina intermedia]|uniref:Glycosyltransferase 2-like domain-containing protein n=1 Tax=Aquimarina intermedia TaxID=350814 RepID=A0A5S5CG46_9FLAO|nr:TIGR04283 family arsenosugar biosynthesis glycosyltransferase [Aquimarina intermedia]TYP77256.1 hypothetical protein BD809_101408 [Aquimarina intermedia]